jgi:hypothetical protein
MPRLDTRTQAQAAYTAGKLEMSFLMLGIAPAEAQRVARHLVYQGTRQELQLVKELFDAWREMLRAIAQPES